MITHPWPNDPEQEDKFLLLSFPVVTPASAMMLADTTETETLGHDPCHQGMESKDRRQKMYNVYSKLQNESFYL